MEKTAEEILNEKFVRPWTMDWYEPVLKAMEEYRSLPSCVTEQQLEEMAEKRYCSPHGNVNPETAAFIAGFKVSCPVSEWVSVEDRLPTETDADENGKVLIWREMNDGQKSLSKSIFDYWMVKNCDSSTFWMPLPTPPTTK